MPPNEDGISSRGLCLPTSSQHSPQHQSDRFHQDRCPIYNTQYKKHTVCTMANAKYYDFKVEVVRAMQVDMQSDSNWQRYMGNALVY